MTTAGSPRDRSDQPVGPNTEIRFPDPPPDRTGWPWTGDDPDAPLEPPDRDPTAPKVTIITPSFNQGRYLEEAIRSVLLQDHPNLEYIVIDGGSTDETVTIIKRYEPWITYWVSEPDDGQADAINRGFELADGEYLGWLNADDILYQGFVAQRVREFSDRPTVALIYGDVHSGWDDGKRHDFRGEPLSYLDMLRTLRVSIPQQSAIWRKTVVDRLGGLDPRWHVVLDREFFLRVARNTEIEYIPGPCGFFRQHDEAKSVAEKSAWVTELPLLYHEFFAAEDLSPEEAELKRQTMAAVHLMCAEILLGSRDWRRWVHHLAKATGWSPRHAATGFLGARIQSHRLRRTGRSKQDGPKAERSE